MKFRRFILLIILSTIFLLSGSSAFATAPELPDSDSGTTIDVARYWVLTNGGKWVYLNSTGFGIPLIGESNKAAIIERYGSKWNYQKDGKIIFPSHFMGNSTKVDTTGDPYIDGGDVKVYGMPFDLNIKADPGTFWKKAGGILGQPAYTVPPSPFTSGSFSSWWMPYLAYNSYSYSPEIAGAVLPRYRGFTNMAAVFNNSDFPPDTLADQSRDRDWSKSNFYKIDNWPTKGLYDPDQRTGYGQYFEYYTLITTTDLANAASLPAGPKKDTVDYILESLAIVQSTYFHGNSKYSLVELYI